MRVASLESIAKGHRAVTEVLKSCAMKNSVFHGDKWSLRQLLPLLFIFGFGPLASIASLDKTFVWESYGEPETLNVKVPNSLYAHYQSKPRTYRYGNYLLEDQGYDLARALASAFEQRAEQREMSEWQLVNMVVDFVQSLPYLPEAKGEYPKYPVETIVENGGDCEDTSILLAAILDELSVNCVLLSPPGHMAVGVAATGLAAKRYIFNGQSYYFVETTGKNWEIGAIPKSYMGNAKVYTLPNPEKERHILAAEKKEEPVAEVITVSFFRKPEPKRDIYPDRRAYHYTVKLEGAQHTLDEVEQVQYRRIHPVYSEYNNNSWLVAYDAKQGFSKDWIGWEAVPVRVRVILRDGNYLEQLVTFNKLFEANQ